MKNPKIHEHMNAINRAVCKQQGGAYPEGGGGGGTLPEVFDKNRGSDTGGSNSPGKSYSGHGSGKGGGKDTSGHMKY